MKQIRTWIEHISCERQEQILLLGWHGCSHYTAALVRRKTQ